MARFISKGIFPVKPSFYEGGMDVLEIPDCKVGVANKGPTWVLAAPGGPHIDPVNLAIRDSIPVSYCPHRTHGTWYMFPQVYSGQINLPNCLYKNDDWIHKIKVAKYILCIEEWEVSATCICSKISTVFFTPNSNLPYVNGNYNLEIFSMFP